MTEGGRKVACKAREHEANGTRTRHKGERDGS